MITSTLKTVISGKSFKIIAGLFVIYVLFAYFAVNPLARYLVHWAGEKKLASQMTVENVRFDPFGLVLTIDNLHLNRMDGQPLASFKHLSVNMESSGLLHFAWRFKDIRLSEPQANVDIAPDGKLNWAELIAKLNESKDDQSGMPRVIIDHVLIEAGNVQYTERNRPVPFKAELKPLGLELEKLSTLPEDRGDYLIVATLPEQGGKMKWKGDFSLNPVASTGTVQVQEVKLAKLLQAVDQKSLPVHFSAGDLTSSFAYKFAMIKAEPTPYPQASLNDIAISLDNTAGHLNAESEFRLKSLDMHLPRLDFSMQKNKQLSFSGLTLATRELLLSQHDARLLELPQIDVKGLDFDLTDNRLKVTDIMLQEGKISALRATDGSIDLQRLLPVDNAKPVSPENTIANDAASKSVSIKSPSLKNTPSKNISTDPAKPFNFEIANIQFQHWKAELTDQSFIKPLHTEIKDITIGLSVNNNGEGIAIHQLNTTLGNISVQSASAPQSLLSLEKLSLQDAEINLKDNTIKLPALVFSGLQTQLLKMPGNGLNWQTALEPLNQASNQSGAATDNTSQALPWKLDIGKIALQNGGVHVEDNSMPKPVILDIQNAAFELQNTSLNLAKVIPVKARIQLKQGGQLDVDGKLALAPFKADLQLKLDKLSLKPFSPYLNQLALLQLDDGQASLHGKMSIISSPKFSTQFAGGFSVNKLAITEEDSNTPFLSWQEISSDSLKLGLNQNRLHMDELHVTQLVGKLIIFEDKTLNIKRMLRTSATTTDTSAATSAPTAATSADSTTSTFPVRIDRVSIDNSSLEFADLSLVPQFGTHINSLAGVINNLSSDPNTTALAELDGKVDDYGSVRIRGSIQPFHATDFTDLKLSFHNLEMNRLTPYSGKFAGRKIDSGKLSVDLEYKIKARKLAGENKFVINSLKLGERVDSQDATNLPLDLAIALLEDSDGIIDLDLPISGSLDDPQFSYGKVIWKAFINVLGKIVTSPFHALGKLFGSDSDKPGAIAFEPGKDAIAPEQQEKLKSIAGALSKRTSLHLGVSPTYDEVADKAALQEQMTRHDVLTEMGVKLKDGETPGPIDLNNIKARSAIESLLKERKGEGHSIKVLRNLKDTFKTAKSEDNPKYADMLEQLKLTADVPETALVGLAKSRANSMQSFLIDNAHLDPSRVSIGEVSKIEGSKDSVDMKMNLDVNKSAR